MAGVSWTSCIRPLDEHRLADRSTIFQSARATKVRDRDFVLAYPYASGRPSRGHSSTLCGGSICSPGLRPPTTPTVAGLPPGHLNRVDCATGVFLCICPQAVAELFLMILLVLRSHTNFVERLEAFSAVERLVNRMDFDEQSLEIQGLLLPILRTRVDRVGACPATVKALATFPRDEEFRRWARRLGARERQGFLTTLERIVEATASEPHVNPKLIARRVALDLWEATQDLAVARGFLGCSRSELAQMLGLHRSTVARWESGSHRPSESSLEKVETLLGMHLARLHVRCE